MKINQSIITDIKTIILNSRDIAIRAVDTERVRMYWRIGQRIFVEEQQEKDRADYGSQLLKTISKQLHLAAVYR
ncbi:DUF1016 N-terminal domain-containing protein [Mucilaginibacter sp. RCC_168]|uniref:DUF1016 N-terminal domain-containing protein n=1 Tax=Mucilaginibacter sp. RCC_168 TaxID=3239221 RepID=UPI0035250214